MTGDLAQRLLAGDRRALAQAISLVEDGADAGRDLLAAIYAHTGRAQIVGITGGSGAGKSTLTGALARVYRARGRTVGIVAVDPTSPFTHGALLGDRIRMQELTRDPDVFVRSMATRGGLGGLAPATAQVAAVLDAAGKDVVLIETVGAGQDEVEVASAAETTVVVLTPAGGDEIQTMKAGIMEVADVLAVNKADLPGADVLLAHLNAMATMATRGAAGIAIVQTIATKDEGVEGLADAIDEHRRRLEASGELERGRKERARRHVLALARQQLLASVLRATESAGLLEGLVEAVAAREVDPSTAARRLIEGAGGAPRE